MLKRKIQRNSNKCVKGKEGISKKRKVNIQDKKQRNKKSKN